MNYIISSRSTEDTIAMGIAISSGITKKGIVIALHGDLGSGKTCFVKGLAKGMGWEGTVTSPTFTLIHEYRTGKVLFHIDLYRLEKIDDLFAIEMEDCFHDGDITAVEWAEKAALYLPEHTIHFFFRITEKDRERIIEIKNWPETIVFPSEMFLFNAGVRET